MSYLQQFLNQREGQGTGSTDDLYNVQLTNTYTNPDDPSDVRTTNRSPSEIQADITRAQWADIQSAFHPIEELAADAVLNPERRQELTDQAVGIAGDAVTRSYDNTARRTRLLRSRANTGVSKRTAKAETVQNAINQSADLVGARNGARQYVRDREMTLLGG